jgi:hypothetical protein
MTVRTGQPSLLGWQSDGDAVVVLSAASGATSATPPQVVALHPAGGHTALITVPRNANRIDVAGDLLDRFGGPAPSIGDHVVDWLAARGGPVIVVLSVVALLVVARVIHRRRRSRA